MALRETEWDACLLEPRRDAELERRVRALGGNVSGTRFFAPLPWLAERIGQMHAAL